MQDEDEVGFSLKDLTGALRKVGRNLPPSLAARAMRAAMGGRGGGGRGGGGRGGAQRVADPTEMRSAALSSEALRIGRRFEGAKMVPVGFPPFVFSSTSGNILTASIQPQSALVARKLVISVVRTGASAATQQVSLVQAICGSDNQLPVVPGATTGVPVSLFASDVNDNQISWAPVQVGQLLTLQLAISGASPTTTDTIVVSVGLNCLTAS